MCGRYNFSAEESAEIQEIVREINDRLNNPAIKTGEIYPTNLVPVLLPGQDKPEPTPMIWGFPHYKNSGVIINARAETVLDKKMFRDSVAARRCVVPSTGFYEWSRSGREKTKYLFRKPGEPLLYMAGIWNTFREKDGSAKQRFVVLTTQANESMKEDTGELSLFPEEAGEAKLIHDRMPVIFCGDEHREWLSDAVDLARIFDRSHVVVLEKWAV